VEAMDVMGERNVWRRARDKARSFEQSQGRGIPSSPIRARGIFRMPSQSAIFSFNHALSGPRGYINWLLSVCMTARSCQKAMMLSTTTRDGTTKGLGRVKGQLIGRVFQVLFLSLGLGMSWHGYY